MVFTMGAGKKIGISIINGRMQFKDSKIEVLTIHDRFMSLGLAINKEFLPGLIAFPLTAAAPV